jgi:hypothetical protein
MDSDLEICNETENGDEIENSDKPENHPVMKALSSNWKLIGIIGAFINRCILEKVDLNRNLVIKDKKLVSSPNTGDPTILNVTNVDVYSLNLFRQIHQAFDMDIKYLKSKNTTDTPRQWESDPDELCDTVKNSIDKILIGMVTLNEQASNFVSDGFENLYDQKTKKVIEYFVRQREYYLSIAKTKVKYNDSDETVRALMNTE